MFLILYKNTRRLEKFDQKYLEFNIFLFFLRKVIATLNQLWTKFTVWWMACATHIKDDWKIRHKFDFNNIIPLNYVWVFA